MIHPILAAMAFGITLFQAIITLHQIKLESKPSSKLMLMALMTGLSLAMSIILSQVQFQ